MKRSNIMTCTIIAIVALVLASCSKTPEYTKLVKADSDVLTRIDIKQFSEKCGDNKDIADKLKGLLKEDNLKASTRTRLEAIIDDPAEAGVDLREPLVIAVNMDSGKETTEIVGTLLDKDDFKDLIECIANEKGDIKLKEANGISYLADEESILAFDDESFYFGLLNKAEDKMVAEVEKKFSGEMPNQLKDSKQWVLLTSKDGVTQTLINGSLYDKIPYFRFRKNINIKLDELAILTNVNLEKGMVSMEYEVITDNEECKKMIADFDDMFPGIKGDFCQYVSSNGIVVAANINGEKVTENLKGIEEAKDILSGAEKYMKVLNGDITLGIIPMGGNIMDMNIALYLATKDNTLANELGGLGKMIKCEAKYADGATAVVSGNEPFTKAEPSVKSSEVSGKHLYISVNYDAIKKLDMEIADEYAMIIDKADRLTLTYDGEGKGSVILYTKDQDKYPTEYLMQEVKKQL